MFSALLRNARNFITADDLKTVQRDGLALMNIPTYRRTEEVCSAAVCQNGWAIKYVPEDKRTDLMYSHAVCQNGMTLALVPKERLNYSLKAAAIFQNGLALGLIPENERILEWCLDAVCNKPEVLAIVPENIRTTGFYIALLVKDLSLHPYIPKEMRTVQFYVYALEYIPKNVSYIPEDMQPAIYRLAVQQNGLALKNIPEAKRSNALCLLAVQQNGLALRYVPKKSRTLTICSEAVQQSGLALAYVPGRIVTPHIKLTAVRQHCKALKFIAKNKRTFEECLIAVQKRAVQLAFVPETMKADIIRHIGVRTILLQNYKVLQYFPLEPDFTEEIKATLASVKNMVISEATDDEVLDAHSVAVANKKETTISLYVKPNSAKKDFMALLADLQSANHVSDLHVTLVGHASRDSGTITGLHYTDIALLCKTHPSIKHIQLLGCHTAQAAKPKEEIAMNAELVKKIHQKAVLQYGLMTSVAMVDTDKILQEKCLKFCKNNKLDGVYVLHKTNSESYQLFSMKYDKTTDTLTQKMRPVLKNPLRQKILNKSIPFPPVENALLPVRGKGHPLTLKELSLLRDLVHRAKRFDKDHPKYQDDKKTFPFLATIHADINDLRPSLMQKLASELIKLNVEQTVTLKAPTKILHVDTAHRTFTVANSYLYRPSYGSSFFKSKKSNIQERKLLEERYASINDVLEDSSKNTQARMLKVTVN